MILFGPTYGKKSEIETEDLRDLIEGISNLENDMEKLGIPIKVEATVLITFPEPEKGGRK